MQGNQKHILMIAPISPYFYPSIVGTAPLSGLLILGTILKNKGYSVRVIDETIKVPDYDAMEDVDVVLISSMSATVKRAYAIADLFRAKGKKVVLGGIHATFQPEETLEHCDQVVIGEAEEVIIDVVEGIIRSKIVHGIRSEDLSQYPLPDYSLVYGMKKNPDVIGVATSRGCPFSCKFCSLSPLFGRTLRSVPIDSVIQYLSQFKTIKKLSFHDANFAICKEKAIELLQKMKDNGIFPRYSLALQSINAANNEKLLQLMAEVSDFHILIGFESINQDTLDFYHKKQTPEMIKNIIKKIHDYDVKIMGNFVFGADTDDKGIFQKIVDFCNYTEVDTPGFDCLTPFVGTELRAELEQQNRIFYNDWDLYDMQHAVFFPKQMSPLELQEGLESAYENFYSTRSIMHQLKRLHFFQPIEILYTQKFIKARMKQNESYMEYLQHISSNR